MKNISANNNNTIMPAISQTVKFPESSTKHSPNSGLKLSSDEHWNDLN